MAVLRHRALALFLMCLVFTLLCLALLPPSRSRNQALHNLVLETHQKLSNVIQSADLKEDPVSLLAANPTQLAELGLLEPAPAPPPAPPLVSAVEAGQAELALGWLRSAEHWLGAGVAVVVWDLGLGRVEREAVAAHCNSSLLHCSLLQFDWARWPGHVREPRLHCHRPIIIQSTLRDHGGLVWLNIDHRLTTDSASLLALAQRARAGGGVLAWPEQRPANMATTALTHPKMFAYFDKTRYEEYAFQHMVGLSSLVILASDTLNTKLMLPWLQCVLTEACVNPIGAQDTGCRFDKKPQFRYSGCHRYDVSAFNIVLGELFSFQEAAYTGGPTFFRRVDQDARRGGNTSSSPAPDTEM